MGVTEYLKDLESCGVDAIIVSDPLIIDIVHENKINIPIHISTQYSSVNYETVLFWKSMGAERVVLGRECSRDEIKEIIDKTGVEIETFVHGAMCSSYSGRCVLSNYFTNRDANRGGCAQVCRFSFDTNESKEFTMALKDMNMAEYIGDLIDIGVTSLKVEGRMRSLYYLATVIGTYREIIDRYYDKTLTPEVMEVLQERLDRVANRETSTHYFMKEADWTDQYYTGRSEVSNQDYLGQVIEYKDGLVKFYERNYFEKGDLVELFTPSGEHISFVVEELYDSEMNIVDVARHPDDIYYLKFDSDIEIPEYSMIKIVERSGVNER